MESITSSRLFTTRQGTILLGVIAAVIAAIALLVYLNHYRNQANANDTVRVLVAKSVIEKGTPGDVIAKSPGLFGTADIPKKQVETGAIVDTATLTGKVALVEIDPNTQLTAADFGTSTGSIADGLKKGERAVVVPLGSPQEVGGQITGGSHVDFWVSSSGQGSTGVSRPIAKLLFQNMYVINAGTNGGNVTLRATAKQAGQIIFASQNAQIWLVLRPTLATNIKPPVVGASAVTGG